MKERDIEKFIVKLYQDINEIKNRLNHLLLQEYSLKEAAIELKLAESTLYKIDPLHLPFLKRGKFRVYRREDILAYKKKLEGA